MFGTLDALDRDFQPVDREISDLLQTYWVNFPTWGDPNGAGRAHSRGVTPPWPRYRGGPAEVLHVGDTVHVGAVPDLERVEFIDSVVVTIPGG